MIAIRHLRSLFFDRNESTGAVHARAHTTEDSHANVRNGSKADISFRRKTTRMNHIAYLVLAQTRGRAPLPS